jgi:hypothetical protein
MTFLIENPSALRPYMSLYNVLDKIARDFVEIT